MKTKHTHEMDTGIANTEDPIDRNRRTPLAGPGHATKPKMMAAW